MTSSARILTTLALWTLCMAGALAAEPSKSPDTTAWWRHVQALSGDDLEGRDTGSSGYQKAADRVASAFKAAGLQPGGEDGGYFQTVRLKEVSVPRDGAKIRFEGPRGEIPLSFLHEVSVRPTEALPAHLEGAVRFAGYCGVSDVSPADAGRVLLCFAARRAGRPGADERLKAAALAGASALIEVDDPGFDLEPARWPDAYARAVAFLDAVEPPSAKVARFRLSAAAFRRLLVDAGRDGEAVLGLGSKSLPLPSFDLPERFVSDLTLARRTYASPNILGLLPGRDPTLRDQVLVLSAHLDGYGRGEPVDGDDIYNGAFDDAAYVATLIRLAERRNGQGYPRTVLFAVFTGEEKGLLGARWFTRRPTVPAAALAADINLDQLRPLFPLKILTMLAKDRTSLTRDVAAVAARRGVEIREDLEPERRLLQRADHWPFLQIGVPATGFIFGFDRGTEAERRYREWYRVRYHRPQDDIGQPIDFKAAGDFNDFFYDLVEQVASDPERPTINPGETFK